MPNLRSIVPIFNTAIQAGAFTKGPFQKASFAAIAELIKRTGDEVEQKFPAIVANAGECTAMAIDDDRAFQLYHRILSITYSDPEVNYGDLGTTLQEDASMRVIVMGDRGRLLQVPENIMAAVQLWMPRKLTHAQLSTLQLLSCDVTPSDIDLDMENVFNEEFPGTEFNLKPNSIMAAMNYKITTTFNKNCFQLCN